jgi:hypothetical protein
MERAKRWKEKILGDGCRSGSHSPSGLGHWLVVITGSCLALSSIGLIGCGVLKKASIVSLAAGGGALAGTVLSGGVAAPILGATTTAFVADVVTATTLTGNNDMNNCAPDNFWTLLGSLIEMGGWALLLIVIVPMLFSWLLPGPIKFKGKEKKADHYRS